MSADAEKEDKQTRKNSVVGNKTCRVCKAYLKKKPQNFNEESISCDCCSYWVHAVCAQLDEGKHAAISKHNLHWFCQHCEVGAGNLFAIISQLKKDVEALKREIHDKETENSITNRLSICEKDGKNLTEQVSACQKATLPDDQRELMKKQILEEIKADKSFTNSAGAKTPEVNTEQLKKDIVQQLQTAPDRNKNNPWNLPPGSTKETPNLKEIVSDEMKELREIEKIKNNLVISGIQEDEERDDLDTVMNIIRDELEIEAEITSLERCGKKRPDSTTPRPIKLVMSNPVNRRKILSKAKILRESEDEDIKSNVYIRPDQTRKQQEQSKNLRDQRRELIAANPGKKYVIKNNAVIEI